MTTLKSISEAFARLPLTALVASDTNPRTTFNEATLAELAAAIQAMGVHTPILVRPLPGERVTVTGRKITHEIVCGERRFRASKLAGVPDIPCLVRHLTDAQVLEIQLVENLQRDDLTELEEADGYKRLMDTTGMTADAVALKIGKSRSHVFARLKLRHLGPEGRKALQAGQIDASHGLVIARIPDSKLQAKATQEIITQGEWNDAAGHGRHPMTYRAALQHVQRNYMLALDTARFKIISEDLVPGAGSCKACTKRTGHDPDLFADIKGADICTDPPCFHKKEEAHAAILVKEARAKGQTVIAGKEALELKGNSYQDKFKGYRRLDSAEDSPTGQPLRKIIGTQMKAEGIKPVLIESARSGAMVECLPNEVVLKLLKAVEQKAATGQAASKEVKKLVDDKKAKAAAKAKAQFEQGWRDLLLTRTWAQITNDGGAVVTPDVFRYLALQEAASMSTSNATALCELLDLGSVAPHSALKDYLKDSNDCSDILLLCIMQRDSGADSHSYGGHVANEGLMLVAGAVFKKELTSVIEDVKKDVKSDVKKTLAPSAKTTPLPQASTSPAPLKAAPAKPPKAKPAKLTAAQAQSGIAAAMQSAERAGTAPPDFAPGLRDASGSELYAGRLVHITKDTNRLPPKNIKHAGKQGTITEKQGDLSWWVTFKGKPGGLACFSVSELDLIEGAA